MANCHLSKGRAWTSLVCERSLFERQSKNLNNVDLQVFRVVFYMSLGVKRLLDLYSIHEVMIKKAVFDVLHATTTIKPKLFWAFWDYGM